MPLKSPLLSLLALCSAISIGHGQIAYDYSRIEVKQANYQQANPAENWGINEDYLLYLPDDFNAEGDPYPVLIFLHGAGARGADLRKVSNLPPMLQGENGSRNFPFVLIAPQSLADSWHGDPMQAELMTFFEEVVELYNIDRNRIYVTGQSMGGVGTWVLLKNYPDYFAAAAPICGRTDPTTAPAMVDIPIWAFHGRLDRTIEPQHSIDIVNAIVAAGGKNARLTIYEDIGHEVWWTVFKRPDIYDWFLTHKKGEEPYPIWNEYTVGPAGYADTGDWMGSLQVEGDPWVWLSDAQEWIFYPESHVISSSGKWIFSPRFQR
jgi:poly(3-hydroxybutyrate) depolymerase